MSNTLDLTKRQYKKHYKRIYPYSTTLGKVASVREIHRRTVISTLLLLEIVYSYKKPTHAGLFSEISDEEYMRDTSKLINLATETTSLNSSAEGKDERVALLRTSINDWVAK